jgi:hypothetical protein
MGENYQDRAIPAAVPTRVAGATISRRAAARRLPSGVLDRQLKATGLTLVEADAVRS